MTETLHYAYAVVPEGRADIPEELRGVAGAGVRTVAGSGLAAVVSPVSAADFDEQPLRAHLEDMRWLEATARGHQQVVDAVAAQTCALPLRLATVCRGEEGVRRMLATGREHFQETIRALDGRHEWGVKVYADPAPDPAPAAAPAAAPSGTSGGAGGRISGRDYLRQRRAQRQSRDASSRRAEEWARTVHETLGRSAEDSRLHRPQDARLSGQTGENVLNGAYLVPHEEAGAFTALVGGLADRAEGVRVQLTGPWAPYSFTGPPSGAGEGA
ncbi:GvpL/GvpF family gas vesicle protein [Streptomyces lycii]|uniref:GvpL/GvpF family gas vesicle protein n=1 Tax=Streptomyces lycii TaxID=2654337 RepID=A0ABQ7FF77_9ACTN|nr:GvpL/GvpF family gas vesicle protein [Streptomyces lycii]KAF4407178.1 GvpL/GvpF family gas vesicle protein [Streptomyces lycii]